MTTTDHETPYTRIWPEFDPARHCVYTYSGRDAQAKAKAECDHRGMGHATVRQIGNECLFYLPA